MDYPERLIIVTAAVQAIAQAIFAGLEGPDGEGMFITGAVSKTPPFPAEPTHFLSSGPMYQSVLDVIETRDAQGVVQPASDASPLFAACQGVGLELTLSECQQFLADMLISEQTGLPGLSALGFKKV